MSQPQSSCHHKRKPRATDSGSGRTPTGLRDHTGDHPGIRTTDSGSGGPPTGLPENYTGDRTEDHAKGRTGDHQRRPRATDSRSGGPSTGRTRDHAGKLQKEIAKGDYKRKPRATDSGSGGPPIGLRYHTGDHTGVRRTDSGSELPPTGLSPHPVTTPPLLPSTFHDYVS